ncbi:MULTISPECIES: hypothetical protein [unclassified Salinicola]|uniref:hypothetical protein n=1 Tax=unclassified Salinicola TaxID=2634022 RepID=UPI001A8F0DA2|nr:MULTISPECIES: hypothetical protein [unclassified Salinicola]MCE3028770.1 hypothetical protein [Salinicola sp. DM10]WIX32278.1 hypothetical protein QO259_15930 [Salinicola sp. JS01]
MEHQISCTRCGNTQTASSECHQAWDEITCIECGDFIDTYGHQQEIATPNYLLHTLNLARSLSLQMARAEHRSGRT